MSLTIFRDYCVAEHLLVPASANDYRSYLKKVNWILHQNHQLDLMERVQAWKLGGALDIQGLPEDAQGLRELRAAQAQCLANWAAALNLFRAHCLAAYEHAGHAQIEMGPNQRLIPTPHEMGEH